MQASLIQSADKETCDPPFRLESVEAVELAERNGLMGMSRSQFKFMQAFAAKHALVQPPALQAALTHCHDDFLMLRTERVWETRAEPQSLAALDSIDDCFRLAEKLTFIDAIVGHTDPFSCFERIPACCKLRGNAESFSRYEWTQNIKKMISREMRRLIQTGSPKACSIEQLREIITAFVLFMPANEDVLVALRTGEPDTPLSSTQKS